MEAAAAAQYGGEPPPDLELAWVCDKWGLPDSGAVLDQSVLLLNRMRTAKNVYDAFHSMMNFSGDQKTWSEEHPVHWQIVAKTQRLRMEMEHDG